MKSGIYKILNIVNRKFYIGSSKNIEKRWKRHLGDLKNKKHHCLYLQRAWNKYGESNFVFILILDEDYLTSNELLIMEGVYIKRLKPAYNIGSVGGGDNISNHPELDKIKEKHSINGKQRWANKTEKEKKEYGDRLKGENNPNWKGGSTFCECGSRISSNSKTCMKCKDVSGIKNSFYGRTHSEETKQKIKNCNLGRKPVNSKKISVNDKIYLSAADAAKELNVCCATITWRVRSKNPKFKGYFYL